MLSGGSDTGELLKSIFWTVALNTKLIIQYERKRGHTWDQNHCTTTRIFRKIKPAEEELFRSFAQVKVQLQQCTNTPLHHQHH